MKVLAPRRNAGDTTNTRAYINVAWYALLGGLVVVPIFRTIQALVSLTQDSDRDVHDEKLSFQTSSDPLLEPLNCLELLDSYKKLEIPELKVHTDELPYHQSYLRLTRTDSPFYLSTSDEMIDRVRTAIFKKGDYYEKRMTQAMQSILRDESVQEPGEKQKVRPIMLDVGGNVGWFSMLSAAHGAEVYVFEPNVVNMIRLCESAVLNGWSLSSNPVNNQLHPYMKGVSNNHGEEHQMYKVLEHNPGTFTFSENFAGNAEVPGGLLQLVTLNALAQEQNWLGADAEGDNNARIAILKIDVEGLELKVFQGAKELLKSGTVKNIFMEWKKSDKKEESAEWEEILSLLLDAGYKLYKIGNVPGPKDIVTETFGSGKELMVYLTSTMPIPNANLWIRLVETSVV